MGGAIAQDTQAIEQTEGSDSQGILSQLQTDDGGLQLNNNCQLTTEIESALASDNPVVVVQMELPASEGGLLNAQNSTPSVESVVMGDMSDLAGAGVTIPADVTAECTDGQTDVTSSHWQAAYVAFQTCYQDLAAPAVTVVRGAWI